MLPEIRSYCCAFCSLPVVRIYEPSAWPRSLDRRIYNDLYRLWGPTWLYNIWFATARVRLVAAGKIPTANPREIGFLSCSDSDILEAHERLLPAIQQLREFPDPLPHCCGHWIPGMNMPVRGLHWTDGWYWSEEEEVDQGVQEEEAEDLVSPPSSVYSVPQEISKPTLELTTEPRPLMHDASEGTTVPLAQRTVEIRGPIHNTAFTNPCTCGILNLSARAYRANRVFCGDSEERRKKDDELPLSFCTAYSHLYNIRVNRPIEIGHGIVRVMKPPWYRPMWHRPGSHRRRPWPDVPTTKDLHRYISTPLAGTFTTGPASETEVHSVLTALSPSMPTEDAEVPESSSPELELPDMSVQPMSHLEESTSNLAILHDGSFINLCLLFSRSLLILCFVTWRIFWPLVHTLMRRFPRAVTTGAGALAEELLTDISCLGRGLGRVLRSMTIGAAAAGRAAVGVADACSVILWRLFVAMEGDSSARIDSDSLAFCYFLSSIRNIARVSISAVPTDILASSLAYSFVISEPKLDRHAKLRYPCWPQFTLDVEMHSSYEGAYLLRVRLRTLCAYATRMSVALSCALEYDKRVSFS